MDTDDLDGLEATRALLDRLRTEQMAAAQKFADGKGNLQAAIADMAAFNLRITAALVAAIAAIEGRVDATQNQLGHRELPVESVSVDIHGLT